MEFLILSAYAWVKKKRAWLSHCFHFAMCEQANVLKKGKVWFHPASGIANMTINLPFSLLLESLCPTPAVSFSTWRPIISSLKVWYCSSVPAGSQKHRGLHYRLGERSTLFDFHKGYYLYVFIDWRFLITYFSLLDGTWTGHESIYICVYIFIFISLSFCSRVVCGSVCIVISHLWCIKFRWEEDCWGQSWSRCERWIRNWTKVFH